MNLVLARRQSLGREEIIVWMNLAVILVLLVGVYGFARLAGFRTKRLSSHTNRTAEDLYDTYADSVRQQDGLLTATADHGESTIPPPLVSANPDRPPGRSPARLKADEVVAQGHLQPFALDRDPGVCR